MKRNGTLESYKIYSKKDKQKYKFPIDPLVNSGQEQNF